MTETPPRLWIKVDLGDGRQLGPGKITLLKAIAQESSIAAAARSLSMSYRRAWLLVDEMNRDLGAPVVETRIGGRGGAHLTDLGSSLVEAFDALSDAAAGGAEPALKQLNTLIRKAGKGG
jgi:molybdate transport system regulatory protein